MEKTPVRLAADEELAPTPGPNENLPPINVFATKSFWLIALAIILPLLKALTGWEPPVGGDEFANLMVVAVSAILTMAGYLQRAAPNFRLVLRK